MFGWFNKKPKEPENPVLCSMCNKWKPIMSNMGDEFCFLCLSHRAAEVMGINTQPLNYEPTEQLTQCGHSKKCVIHVNKCFHVYEAKDNCSYKENCEFVNPQFIVCYLDCPIYIKK